LIEPIDYEQQEPISIGKCKYCKDDIMAWEDDYYKIGDDLIHDDCIIDYIKRYRIRSDT
jgi:hypothetical protein